MDHMVIPIGLHIIWSMWNNVLKHLGISHWLYAPCKKVRHCIHYRIKHVFDGNAIIKGTYINVTIERTVKNLLSKYTPINQIQ